MLIGVLGFFAHDPLATAIAAFSFPTSIPAAVFWPCFAAIAGMAVGLTTVFKNEVRQRRGIDKVLPFGRIFLAVPMAVFGADHMTQAADIANIVPKWMPWHMFWTYLVGVALIAASLSILFKIQARLAALLLGLMLAMFVVMLHIPSIVAHPGNRFTWTYAFRDLTFSGGAFAYAGSLMRTRPADGTPWLVTLGRIIIGSGALFFGPMHFLHPERVPGIPLEMVTPTWIPGHLFWTYFAGVVLLACGPFILVNVKARMAATYLGIVVLLTVLFVYLPILFSNSKDIVNGLNYVFDTLVFSGAALVLADAISEPTHSHSK